MKTQVKVKPSTQHSKSEQIDERRWIAPLKSPPIDGKADQKLITLISNDFQCRQGEDPIKHGVSDQLKLIQIEGR